MGHAPLEDLLPKSGYSIYKLVRMAANRAVELADGKPKMVDTPPQLKTTSVALEEIRAGKLVVAEVADQFAPPAEPAAKAAEDDDEEV